MKKLIALALASVLSFSLLTACTTETTVDGKNEYKILEINFKDLKDTDDAKIGGVEWFSTINEVTEKLDIMEEAKVNYPLPNMADLSTQEFAVPTYFPEFDIYGVTIFSFILKYGSEMHQQALPDQRSGLSNIEFNFYFDNIEETEAFEKKFAEVFEEVGKTNTMFEGFTYQVGSGQSSKRGAAFDQNGVKFQDAFYFEITSFESSQFEDNADVPEEEQYAAIAADVYQNTYFSRLMLFADLAR